MDVGRQIADAEVANERIIEALYEQGALTDEGDFREAHVYDVLGEVFTALAASKVTAEETVGAYLAQLPDDDKTLKRVARALQVSRKRPTTGVYTTDEFRLVQARAVLVELVDA